MCSTSWFCEKTKVHAVGDGAPWICEQVEKQFGGQATYMLDFYHVSEYLAAAAKCCNSKDVDGWVRIQQDLLKANKASLVIEELKKHIDLLCSFAAECSANKCYSYLIRRTNQLNYKNAIDLDLPIGSGEIESAHRYVVQKRLKISGAWWKHNNAQAMLALRVKRANYEWTPYWQGTA